MTTKDFNLVKYVYGRFYAESLYKGEVIFKSYQFYKYRNIINWLKNNDYIYNVKLDLTDKEFKRIKFSFNTHKTMYDRYLKGIENNIGLDFKPMGERIIPQKEDDMKSEPVKLDDSLKAFKDAQKRILIKKAVA